MYVLKMNVREAANYVINIILAPNGESKTEELVELMRQREERVKRAEIKRRMRFMNDQSRNQEKLAYGLGGKETKKLEDPHETLA